MKTTIFVLCLFCAATAAAQTAGVLSGQSQPLRMCENPQHASQHELATEQSLLPPISAYHYEQGERPLWELGTITQPVPLGDIARAYRTQHALAKKAEVILEKQK
jgi:hypothetical protein